MNEQEAAYAASLNQVEIEGDFECQTPGCSDRDIPVAVYLPEVSVLTWKCKNDHKSFIEEFKLF
jgi:hypothetical protein